MPDLVKLALNPAVMAAMTRSIKGLGAGAGMGGVAGGVAGGAIGAVRGYQKARAEGGSVTQGLTGGAKGLGMGAAKGAVLGGALGAAAGAARPGYAAALAPHVPGANFGQRQVHALTGVGDKAYLRSIGGGAADAEKRLATATAGRASAAGDAGQLLKAERELSTAQKGFASSEKAEAMGLYSIPGYAKALARDPKGALKAGVRDQWDNMGTGGRALMYGLPAVGVANELARKTDEAGHGRFERAGRLAGAAASGVVAPLAIGGDLALGGALTGAFGRLGKSVDRLGRKKKNVPSQVAHSDTLEPAGGTTQAEGHILSDRAAGAIPEGINA